MTPDDAITLLAVEPFAAWEWVGDSARRLGAPAPGGAAVELKAYSDVDPETKLPHPRRGQLASVFCTTVMAPDMLPLAARNGQLLTFILLRLVPSWDKAEAWLVSAMRGAGAVQVNRGDYKITFRPLRERSQATLTLERR